MLAAALAVAVSGGAALAWRTDDDTSAVRSARAGATAPLADTYDLRRLDRPARTDVLDRGNGRLVATFTDGARTVVVRGPRRTLAEQSSTATVATDSWVRVAPRPWTASGGTQAGWALWLTAQLASTKPDVLQISTEYLRGAPQRLDDKGSVYAGDADFGIERGDGIDGADFHEYMGVDWTFPNGRTMKAAPRWLGALDCSGYLRIVYGYRSGMTLLTGPVTSTVNGLPRTANAMAYHARSVVVAAGRSPDRSPTDLGELQPGDLVFFALRDDKAHVSHSGIYLGEDPDGRPRFVSSRGSTQGPSFADSLRSRSTLDDPAFRGALRRIIRL